jgi:hypothetical protein
MTRDRTHQQLFKVGLRGRRLRSALFPFAQPHPGHLPLVNSMPDSSASIGIDS